MAVDRGYCRYALKTAQSYGESIFTGDPARAQIDIMKTLPCKFALRVLRFRLTNSSLSVLLASHASCPEHLRSNYVAGKVIERRRPVSRLTGKGDEIIIARELKRQSGRAGVFAEFSSLAALATASPYSLIRKGCRRGCVRVRRKVGNTDGTSREKVERERERERQR